MLLYILEYSARTFGIQKFAKSLLVVADNMQLALNSVKVEDLEQNAVSFSLSVNDGVI